MHELHLEGCSPEPLLDYLKALGLVRIIALQKDRGLRACWKGDSLVLQTSLDEDSLESFLLMDYCPSPLVDPWNKDSGYPSDAGTTIANATIKAIIDAKAARLVQCSRIAAMCDDLVRRFRPEGKDQKKALLSMLRASLPDVAIDWLDSVFTLTEGDTRFPPLLGSGGNDGRLDFVNCFMRAVLEVMDPVSGMPSSSSRHWLYSALHGNRGGGLSVQSIGQFDPGAAGGVNASSSFEGGSLSNPWSFILALEGALMFSSTASRRFEGIGSSQPGYPFSVRPTRAGYASSSPGEKLRGEMWMPLWQHPAGYGEIRALFGEGRATISDRNAGTGLEFARAVTCLGIDRGLSGFTRYMFAERFGKLNFAVPIGRFKVTWSPEADLMDEIAHWVDSLGSLVENSNAVAAIQGAIENAMMGFCRSPGRQNLRRLFLLIGDASALLGRNPQLPAKNGVPPLQGLSPRWVAGSSDGTPEFRLAAALASLSMRDGPVRLLLDPVAYGKWHKLEYLDSPSAVSMSMQPVEMLKALLGRITLSETPGIRAVAVADPGDIGAFIEGSTDDEYMRRLIQSMVLVDWTRKDLVRELDLGRTTAASPGAEFWFLKLCISGEGGLDGWGGIDTAVVRAAVAGNMNHAMRLASVRLKALGRKPLDISAGQQSARALRIAAALLFPVARRRLTSMADKLAPAAAGHLVLEGDHDVDR
jgi:CRISPR-associated protein Csx17